MEKPSQSTVKIGNKTKVTQPKKKKKINDLSNNPRLNQIKLALSLNFKASQNVVHLTRPITLQIGVLQQEPSFG